MCPIFNGCENTAVRSWRVQITFFCLWGWMKREVYKEKLNTIEELAARIMNSTAVIKQERQDDLRGATLTVAKRVEKCIEVDGGIVEHLL